MALITGKATMEGIEWSRRPLTDRALRNKTINGAKRPDAIQNRLYE